MSTLVSLTPDPGSGEAMILLLGSFAVHYRCVHSSLGNAGPWQRRGYDLIVGAHLLSILDVSSLVWVTPDPGSGEAMVLLLGSFAVHSRCVHSSLVNAGPRQR